MERQLKENLRERLGDAKVKSHSGDGPFKLCISGAADIGHCGIDAHEKAKELGREIAKQAGVLVTGATTGFPYWGAIGCREAGGISIGLSPASTEKEHLEIYRLPTDYLDLIIYTGFGFSGRNLLLTRSSDAVFVGCGRIGTINEFTIAYEDNKPIGVLEGDWPTDEVLKEVISKSHRENDKIVFDSDPARLVSKVIDLIRKEREQYRRVYDNHDGVGGGEHRVL